MTAEPDRRTDGLKRLYGRRQSHPLKPRRQKLMETVLPDLRVGTDMASLLSPDSVFDHAPARVWLEIGFGGGEHLAWQAENHPEVGIIGCEPFINGVAKLVAEIVDRKLENVGVHDGDARLVLAGLGDATIDRCFILFPDPWPKTRHHKRRIINPETLNELHRVMRPGAELRFASDIRSYQSWTLDHIRRHGGFDWQADCASDWRTRRDDWPATRYEAKAIRQGRLPAYLTFIRKP